MLQHSDKEKKNRKYYNDGKLKEFEPPTNCCSEIRWIFRGDKTFFAISGKTMLSYQTSNKFKYKICRL